MSQSHSPPPLRHPVPTHPAYIPEPPPTPQAYQRFSSSPAPPGAGTGTGTTSVPIIGSHTSTQSAGPSLKAYPVPHVAQTQRVQAYTSPFQHSQQMGVGGQYPGVGGSMQQQPVGVGAGVSGQPNYGSPPPDFKAWGFDGTTAQLGMQLGHSAVAAGQDYVQKNFGTLLPTPVIKHHFNVSNSYVMRKLRLVLFPWMHRPWARRQRGVVGPGSGVVAPGQAEFLPPREDLNCPDLYIPVMSIVTYILLAALHAGIHSRFNPVILGDSASRATVVVLLDFAFVKLGCYILNITNSSQVVDFISYGGYKFVGVIFVLIAGFIGLRGPLWMLIFAYAFFANAFFLLRSLRTVVLPDASSIPATHATTTVTHAQRRRRIAFLLMEAGLQVLYMGWLVRV